MGIKTMQLPKLLTVFLLPRKMSSMVEFWSRVMYAAEENLLNFMEDVTDHDHSSFPSHNQYDPNDRQTLHSDYYNEHNEDGTYEEVGQDYTFLDASPQPSIHHPYRLQQEQFQTGDVTRMTNVFGFHNDIPDDEKVKYLNIVLGGKYQHGTHDSLAQDEVLTGLVSSHDTLHPRPPIQHPHTHTPANWPQAPNRQSPFYPTRGPSVIRFEHDPQPMRNGYPHPRFRPSPLVEESLREDWAAVMDPGRTINKTKTKKVNKTSDTTEHDHQITEATTTNSVMENSTASP